MVQRAFKKCGISVAIDGSEDTAIKIRGLEQYTVHNTVSESESEEENLFELDSSDEESFWRFLYHITACTDCLYTSHYSVIGHI